jgi:putative membrane protein
VAAEDWNLAYVWAYRLMVVGLDECEVVSATPGLTAREAAVAATRVVPDQGTALGHHARTFDRVRYGHSSVAEQDVNALRELTPILLAQCRKAQDHA